MLNLDGLFTVRQQKDIQEYTRLRVREDCGLLLPEAITLYEQNFLTDDEITKMCEKEYGVELHTPKTSVIPPDIVGKFKDSGAVPAVHLFMSRQLTIVYLPDVPYNKVHVEGYEVEYLPTSPPYYFKNYFEKYGQHKFILPMPVKRMISILVDEAITLGAADLTISTKFNSSLVYYNARKKKIFSKRMFAASDIQDMITFLFTTNTYNPQNPLPQRTGVSLNKDYRGRVECARKYGNGFILTIRLLPNSVFDMTYEELNLSPKTIEFIKKDFMDPGSGMHLIVGATMSGKNTTLLAALKTLADKEMYKIISVEQPVEQELVGIEQLSCDSTEEYREACFSLIRHNPDIVYITETNDAVGSSVVRTANTGKCVFTSLHANSVSGTISRLCDVTGQTADRLIQDIHSIMYQELRRDEEADKVYPYNRYIRLTKEVKQELYGKSLGEQIKIIETYEEGD